MKYKTIEITITTRIEPEHEGRSLVILNSRKVFTPEMLDQLHSRSAGIKAVTGGSLDEQIYKALAAIDTLPS